MVAGSIGGGGRQNYTVQGNTVNLAARLEALNKQYGIDILFDQARVELARSNTADICFTQVDEISVGGLSRPASIYLPGRS